MTPEAQPILVTGAAGFIGRRVVAELVARGWRVRAFLHTHEVVDWERDAAVSVVRGDVRNAATLRTAVAGTSAVVSLAARKMDEPDSHETNVGGARNLVEACRAEGVARVINISSQSAKLARPGIYGRTKREADAVFAASNLAVTTLRPSLVYGGDDSGAFTTVRRFIERLPFVPVLGDGRWVSAPLHVEDVARAICRCLENPATIGRTLDLGGPDLVAFDALVDRIAVEVRGRSARKLHVPLALALPAVRVLRWFWRQAPVSVSNVLGSNQDTALDPATAHQLLGFVPRSLDRGMRSEFGPVEDRALLAEARRFGRYLLGVTADRAVCGRYVAAVRSRVGDREDALVGFVARHPGCLGLLDAACALVRREAELRQRLLVMAALLETSPAHADRFLRPPPRAARLVAGLLVRALSAGAKVVGGLLLLPVATHSHGARR